MTTAIPDGPAYSQGRTVLLDGGLINIVSPQPEYPVKASEKGIEGHVIVIFDVTELGTVENVQIVESSNRLFNKAASKAAYRSRYKPHTVGGIAKPTPGLRKLFRFEMSH